MTVIGSVASTSMRQRSARTTDCRPCTIVSIGMPRACAAAAAAPAVAPWGSPSTAK